MPVIKAAIHYGNDTKEHVLNNAPEAVLRELISNAYDAAAEKIHFGPLIYYNEKIRDRCNPPPKKHGFFFMDNGAGMTNASANADPSESQVEKSC
jgi:HSP90 family molecular chaperone